jgi:hypothetical protein
VTIGLTETRITWIRRIRASGVTSLRASVYITSRLRNTS